LGWLLEWSDIDALLGNGWHRMIESGKGFTGGGLLQLENEQLNRCIATNNHVLSISLFCHSLCSFPSPYERLVCIDDRRSGSIVVGYGGDHRAAKCEVAEVDVGRC